MLLSKKVCRRLCMVAALTVSVASWALDLNDVSFSISFDKGFNADIARGGGELIEKKGDPSLVNGREAGKALKLVNGKDSIAYNLKGNLNPNEGAISFWLSSVDWEGSTGDALQILMHTGDDGLEQLAVQTLWPWGRLFMPLYHKGELVGGFPSGRTCSAPLKEMDDAVAVMRPGVWYHYLITWRDGYEAIYFNGKLAGESKLSDLRLRDLGRLFFLGWDRKKANIFYDPGCDAKAVPLASKPWTSLLDDVTVFRSFVFPNQVEKIFRYGALEYARRAEPTDVVIEPSFYQSSGKLKVAMIAPGGGKKGTLKVTNSEGVEIASKPFVVPEHEPCADVTMNLKDVSTGLYKVSAILDDGFQTPAKKFEIVKPKWLGNTLGKVKDVLPPWTPIDISEGEKELTVKVWGREYVFNGPLPSSIVSLQNELLRAPVDWSFATAGKKLKPLSWEKVKIVERTPARLVLRSKSVVGSYQIVAETRLEYDGMIWCRFDFQSDKEDMIDQAIVNIPFTQKACVYMQYPCRRDCFFPKKKPWTGSFQPYVFVGNNYAGLQWFAESDQWWYSKDSKKVLEVSPGRKGGDLKIRVIDAPVKMPKTFSIAFGLMATPVRPRPANWRGYGCSNPYRAGYPDKYRACSLNYSWWSIAPGWLVPNRWDKKRDDSKKRGIRSRMMPFTSTTFRGIRPYSSKNMNERIPEWSQFGPEWGASPQNVNLGEPGGWNQILINPSKSFIDRYCWEVDELFRTKDVDGLYFDGYAGKYPSANIEAGFGYVDRDGSVKPVYPILAGRELMKRIYALRLKLLPDGNLMIHPATSLIMPVLSFSTVIYDGEFMGWGDITSAMDKKGLAAGLTPDKARYLLNYRQLGLVPTIDTRFIPRLVERKKLRGPKEAQTFDNALALFMLEDVHAVNLGIYSQMRNFIVDQWGIADSNVEFLPYWEDKPAADAGWSSRTSAFIKPDEGKVLLVTKNMSGYGRSPERLAKEGKFGYVIKLNLDKLGLEKGKFKAFDAASLNSLEIPVDGDEISLTMAPEQYRLITLEKIP